MDTIIEYINCLNISNRDKCLLGEIFERNRNLGLSINSERIRILKSALQFLGNPYLRTEELAQNTIDCSTLTSQAYWEGAQIGIPFIAESQRVAKDGMVLNIDEILPADIVVKFKSLEDSPDRTYNHVGLILGKDVNDCTYVIESNSKEGCVISSLDKFNPSGGFRSYIKNYNIEVQEERHQELFKISRKIPKLSRLGARQYCTDNSDRIVHKGIDIYVEENTKIYAPIYGFLTVDILYPESEPCVIIERQNGLKCIIGNITPKKEIINTQVNANQLIGKVKKVRENSKIKYPLVDNKVVHLHFQVEGQIQTDKIINKITIDNKDFYNGLYLAKLGVINLPLKF